MPWTESDRSNFEKALVKYRGILREITLDEIEKSGKDDLVKKLRAALDSIIKEYDKTKKCDRKIKAEYTDAQAGPTTLEEYLSPFRLTIAKHTDTLCKYIEYIRIEGNKTESKLLAELESVSKEIYKRRDRGIERSDLEYKKREIEKILYKGEMSFIYLYKNRNKSKLQQLIDLQLEHMHIRDQLEALGPEEPGGPTTDELIDRVYKIQRELMDFRNHEGHMRVLGKELIGIVAKEFEYIDSQIELLKDLKGDKMFEPVEKK